LGMLESMQTSRAPSVYTENITQVESQNDMDIEVKELIGTGNFSSVYRGVWKGKGDVALKGMKENDEVGFLKEASVLQRLSHGNIVQYLGIYTLPSTEKFIVMELLPLGSISTLMKKEGLSFSTMDLIAFSKQITAGMQYLEQKKIVHRDLALRNILVATNSESKYVAKITDFGLSRSLENNVYYSQENIPVKWSSPEALELGSHSIKSDVYTFGVVNWELFSIGQIPYSEYTNDVARAMIVKGSLLECPELCPEEIYKIMLKCWEREIKNRPSFAQIGKDMENIWKTMGGCSTKVAVN